MPQVLDLNLTYSPTLVTRKGLQRIFSSIRSFIENSSRTKRGTGNGTTFHETMTYFWVHMVHFAIVATKNPTGDFRTFLLLNPQLCNGGMFLHYYSKKLMLHTPEARVKVLLPDKRPLPSLISGPGKVRARFISSWSLPTSCCGLNRRRPRPHR